MPTNDLLDGVRFGLVIPPWEMETQISPLRSFGAPVEMTKGRAVGGPGLDFETWVSPEKSVLPEHPGLKSETWATHSILVRAIFIGDRTFLQIRACRQN